MQRLRRAAFPLALVAALGITVSALIEDSAADLENLVFTSRAERVRLLVPRGWRASEQPSYPGLLLWMGRSEPQGQIVLTAELFTHELYCSWPIPCRTSHESLPVKYACALRSKLEAQHFRVYPIQPGPKDNEIAHLPSIWFEYDDGKHFLRQAIAFPSSPSSSPASSPASSPTSSPDRAFSLVLSAPTSDARATYTRAFEQALRTLHLLSAEETARAESIDAAVASAPGDASTAGASALDGGAVIDAGTVMEPVPTPKVDPTGPCL